METHTLREVPYSLDSQEEPARRGNAMESTFAQIPEAGRGVLGIIAMPVLVVDRAMFLHYANPAAIRMLRTGRHLGEASGIIRCTSSSGNRALVSAIEQVIEHESGSPPGEQPAWRTTLCIRDESGHQPIPVVVSCLADPDTRAEEAEDRIATILIGPAFDDVAVESGLLRSAFELTHAECSVANLIVQGECLKQIAYLRGVSLETIRCQLRTIFDKTGTRRQSDLIRLLAALAVVAGGHAPFR